MKYTQLQQEGWQGLWLPFGDKDYILDFTSSYGLHSKLYVCVCPSVYVCCSRQGHECTNTLRHKFNWLRLQSRFESASSVVVPLSLAHVYVNVLLCACVCLCLWKDNGNNNSIHIKQFTQKYKQHEQHGIARERVPSSEYRIWILQRNSS